MYFVLIFCGILLVAKLGTDVYGAVAKKYGILDKPDAVRKLQKQPIPVGGGVVVYLILLIVSIVASLWTTPLFPISSLVFPLLLASFVLVAMGLYDDKNGMAGKKKLLVQILLSTLVIVFAKNYTDVSLFGYSLNLGHLFYPLAIFWLIGFVNSVNLLDGADGVVTTVGVFLFATIGAIAWFNRDMSVVATTFVLTAALCGFFLCNMPPAKIYLGDTGSTLIGFLAGVLILRACSSKQSIQVLPAICAALIPILDSTFAVVRRLNSGRSIFSTDRAHFHHRVQKRFGRGFALLAALALLQTPLCLAAYAGVYYHNDWIPVAAIVLFVVFVAAANIFGRAELMILWTRCRYRFVKHLDRPRYEQSGEAYHAQGDISWTTLWNELVERVRSIPCVSLHFDVNMPFVNEDYYAEWEERETERLTCFDLPVIVEDKLVGSLILKFDAENSTVRESMDAAEALLTRCRQFIAARLEASRSQSQADAKKILEETTEPESKAAGR